ncbi:hypothetical protein COB28_04150, partial [Candidatus Dependentiae bacterium]
MGWNCLFQCLIIQLILFFSFFMKPQGTQLAIELSQCSKKLLNDTSALKRVLREGIKKCGLTLVKITAHKFSPVGVTV